MFPLLGTLPCVPLIRAITRLTAGYTFSWVLTASMVATVARGIAESVAEQQG